MTRLYFPDAVPAHGECALPEAQAHHAARVLRLQEGDAVTLFDGRGIEYAATIKRIAKHNVMVRIGEQRAVDRESPLAVTLAQGISAGERMDYTIQKAVELGVARIQPLATQRSVVRLNSERAEKRVAHWQHVVIAACEQCGRNVVPPVAPVLSFMDWAGGLPAQDKSILRLMLSPHADQTLDALLAATPGAAKMPALPAVTLLIGAEGGFDATEIAVAQERGFIPIKLGPRILRTETAALVALAVLQQRWGDFK